MFQVVHKIKATRVALLKWNQLVFIGRNEEISTIRAKLGFILRCPFLKLLSLKGQTFYSDSTSYVETKNCIGPNDPVSFGSVTAIRILDFSLIGKQPPV